MTANPYQVLGPSIPPMLGRAALVQCIEGHLSKPTPDHVSVVGPKHYGKSVLLRHLADLYRVESSGYLATAHIDLRHDTPRSDDAFKRRFAEEVKVALRPERTQLAECIDLDDATIHESLDFVFEELEGESARMLVVLDGFDYALAGTELTRNLWDQLRSLAQKASLRLVTGSRRPLRELCRTEESRTSDFWEIFYDSPVRATALDDSDWVPFLQPLLDVGCTLDESARKEITNWTGGVPLLVCALLQELWEQHRGAQHLSKPEICQAAETVLNRRDETLAALWDDCDVDLRSDLGTLAGGDIPLSDLSDRRRRAIESRGFGRVSRDLLRGSCGLMLRYAKEQAPALADLTRLFGTTVGFETHVQTFLELRLKQAATSSTDQTLHDFISRAIEDIERNPELAINGIRGIAERALTLIWEAELSPDKVLPSNWIGGWTNRDRRDLPGNQGELPSELGNQCKVLHLITGSVHTPRQSQYVTKTTYLLIDHLKSVGDFGQHRSKFPETTISVGFAATIVLAAISLVESLTADLQRDGEG